MTNKLLPVALIAALIGGSVGALVMHSRNTTSSNQPIAQDTARPVDAQYAGLRTAEAPRDSYVPAQFETTAEQTAYKSGFADGFRAAEAGVNGERAEAAATSYAAPAPRVVYRNTTRAARTSNARASRQVYYDYQQPRKRSFWQKHRDKLTVAMGAGGGAVVGGLIGGKKGAAIGALAGGGGSALYTYKIRKRDNRY
ncbi:MAG TPA: hypothetical protein VJV03_13130 [Pyrinomonadaceae bacterium]|nr:hypothetical protein [Pyrinomonadaceae bacterium]